jgi:pilus assembly protein CpaF
VTEVVGMESEVVTTQDVYRFDFARGTDEHGRFLGALRPTGLRPTFTERLRDVGIELGAALFEGEGVA